MTPDELPREARAWFIRIKELYADLDEIRTTQNQEKIDEYLEEFELTPGENVDRRIVVIGSLSMRIDRAIWAFAHATGCSYRHAQKFLGEHAKK